MLKDNKNINLALVAQHQINDVTSWNFSFFGLRANNIIELLRTYPTINSVSLVGCYTARSDKLAIEKQMIDNFTPVKLKNADMVLINTDSMQREIDYAALLSQLSTKKSPCNNAFVLMQINDDYETKYQLVFIEKNVIDNTITAKQHMLSDKELKELQNLLNKGQAFKFSKMSDTIIITHGGSRKAFLPEYSHQPLHEVITSFDSKEKYPFLANVTIDYDEAMACLQDSDLKFLARAIKNDPTLTRTIILKGYPNPVHPSLAEKKLLVTRTHALKRSAVSMSFFGGQDNVNRVKIKREYQENLRVMQNKKMDGDTMVRSIKVVV